MLRNNIARLSFVLYPLDPNNEGNARVPKPSVSETQITTSRLLNVDVIGSCNFELCKFQALAPPVSTVGTNQGCTAWSTERAGVPVTILTSIRKALGSNLNEVGLDFLIFRYLFASVTSIEN